MIVYLLRSKDSTYMSSPIVYRIPGGDVSEHDSEAESTVAYKEVIHSPSSEVDTRLAYEDVAPTAAAVVLSTTEKTLQ